MYLRNLKETIIIDWLSSFKDIILKRGQPVSGFILNGTNKNEAKFRTTMPLCYSRSRCYVQPTKLLWRFYVFRVTVYKLRAAGRLKWYTKLKLIWVLPPDWIFMWTTTWRQTQIHLIYSTWCVHLLMRWCVVSVWWIIW